MSIQSHHPSTACPCDVCVHPGPLNIPAGLSQIQRQIASFPEFRKAMLSNIREHVPLRDWNARDRDDFGVMLVEMWAYICDSLSFYDEVIAHESYLRTAFHRASLHHLVERLGYIPRPAVAARVRLTAIADGSKEVLLPKGLAFRSGAFEEEAPQIFELDQDQLIHPLMNQWQVKTPFGKVDESKALTSLFVQAQFEVPIEQGLLLLDKGKLAKPKAIVASETESIRGMDGQLYTKLNLDNPLSLEQPNLSHLHILSPSRTASLWTVNQMGQSIQNKASGSLITLDKKYADIKAGGYVLLERNGEFRAFQIKSVGQVNRNPIQLSSATGFTLAEDLEIADSAASLQQISAVEPQIQQVEAFQQVEAEEELTFRSASATLVPENIAIVYGHPYIIPGIRIPVTQIQLDANLNDSSRKRGNNSSSIWTGSHSREILLHYHMQELGRLTSAPKSFLSSQDRLGLSPGFPANLPHIISQTFALTDANTEGVLVHGRLNQEENELKLNQGESWTPDLLLPVEVYGNVIEASRGESVKDEILGSGDASIPNQRFKLQKKPLTYLLDVKANQAHGAINTLKIYVNDILWTEVSSFFQAKERDQVYIVRQDEDGESYITFGDGVRGQRLPSGTDNVLASYRFGAGAASPPPASITQIVSPVEGLQSIAQPMNAFGGDDAESAEEIREHAPNSVLILGRAISIPDVEAVCLEVPGVHRVQVQWRWSEKKQRPLIHIWYVGEPEIEDFISEKLRYVSDPSTPYFIQRAIGIPIDLSISIGIQARYLKQGVLENVRTHLRLPPYGLLAIENQGIGSPFFRSKLFEAVLGIEGTVEVSGIHWNQVPFQSYAKKPAAGKYFDFENGTLNLTANESLL